MKREKLAVYNLEAPTIRGSFTISVTARGVAMVFFPGAGKKTEVQRRMEKFGVSFGSSCREKAVKAGRELAEYILGGKKRFATPVDLALVSSFQGDVYNALMKIPFGETVTYGELALLAGHPNKARAVGTAMKANPAPIFVPCHRVVSASDGLGGWSGPAGWKEWLLEHEGVRV